MIGHFNELLGDRVLVPHQARDWAISERRRLVARLDLRRYGEHIGIAVPSSIAPKLLHSELYQIRRISFITRSVFPGYEGECPDDAHHHQMWV